jgi:hypothetical protein
MSVCLLKLARRCKCFASCNWKRSCFVLFVEIGNRGASFLAGWNLATRVPPVLLVGIGKKLFVFLEEGMSITDGVIGFE